MGLIERIDSPEEIDEKTYELQRHQRETRKRPAEVKKNHPIDS